MKSTILITSLLVIIYKFNICNSINTWWASACQAATESCGFECDNHENGNGNCWLYQEGGNDGCVLSRRCYCECTWKNKLSADAAVTAPFEIIHKASGKCLDWDGNLNRVYLHDCHNGDNQKWVYYPGNGAVKSLSQWQGRSVGCLTVYKGAVYNGRQVDIWPENQCVHWELSQWKFQADGHINTALFTGYSLDIANGDGDGQIWQMYSDNSNQIFTFPGGAFRGSSLENACQINKLDKVAEDEVDEIAQAAWDIGTAAAEMLPVVGAPISIITSFWNPTEDDGPSPTELVNDIRDEMNVIVDELVKCMDAKITKLSLEIQEDEALGYMQQVTSRLEHIAGASGQDQMDSINNLFDYFNGIIDDLFAERHTYLEYANLLPIYDSLASLWSVVSKQALFIETNENDCINFKNDLSTIRASFQKIRVWIEKAINSIVEQGSLKIVSDGNAYSEWEVDQKKKMEEKYLAHVDFYIKSFGNDISRNLTRNLTVSCSVDGKFAE